VPPNASFTAGGVARRARSRPAKVIPCLITDSPDEQFLVGRLKNDSRVVAGGDSGHGFKHAAGVGELLAQIATGEPAYCAADFLDPARFPCEPTRTGPP
jgi:sarcosine oxidase